MPRNVVSSAFRLSEIRTLASGAPPGVQGRSRLCHSVEQSMRVEGYAVSEQDVRLAADRVLGPSKK